MGLEGVSMGLGAAIGKEGEEAAFDVESLLLQTQ